MTDSGKFILLAEDDAVVAELVMHGLAASEPPPRVVPRLDGLEVLRQIKADDRLRTIPVVMLTSSQDERDVRDSYQLGANAYIVKPVEFRRFMEVLRELNTFWMRINLPPAECSLAATVSGDDSAHSRHDTSLKH
jgi:hypothetical protein